MKCSVGISNFLEEISSLSHSVVFLCFFALIAEEGFLISSCYSLELCIQMLIPFLFSFTFRFFSQLYVRPPQTAILLFCISFPRGWSWSLSPVQCHEVHSSSGTLSIRSSPLNLLGNTCEQIWKTQQLPQDWKRSVFIPIPKKDNAKECSNYCTIALINGTPLQYSCLENPMDRGAW